MRNSLEIAALAVVMVGCKPPQLTFAEDYEREACACKHRDVACVAAARSKFDDAMSTPHGHWYDRSLDAAEWQRHEQAAKECARRVSSCSADDPCGAGSFCAAIDKTTGVGACGRWLAEGETCGTSLDVCGEGMYCDQRQPMGSDECWPVGCPGKCVKGTPPPKLMNPLSLNPPSASALASASASASK